MQDLDLLVLGAYYGEGKGLRGRGISTFVCGVKDDKNPNIYHTVCKVSLHVWLCFWLCFFWMVLSNSSGFINLSLLTTVSLTCNKYLLLRSIFCFSRPYNAPTCVSFTCTITTPYNY